MSALVGPVLVVGTGLLGTSVALACRRAGLETLLDDLTPEHLRTASGLGAGRPAREGDAPQLVVVAVPPDHLAAAVTAALLATDAVVTDVGSIKAGPLAAVRADVTPAELTRYVGSHPMAGSERSGPLAASAALFEGRPWAVVPHEGSDAEATAVVEELVSRCGGLPVLMTPEAHDLAVARVSHLPQLVSSLVAARLAEAPPGHLALAGQGLRDVTRIAASDPGLWRQIVSGNAEAVLALLTELRGELDDLIGAVRTDSAEAVERVLSRGVAGARAIPGKHGVSPTPTAPVFVSVPDHPGELARLFTDAGESGVNIEDVRIDHDPGRDTGLVELVVDETRAEELLGALESRGWVVHR